MKHTVSLGIHSSKVSPWVQSKLLSCWWYSWMLLHCFPWILQFIFAEDLDLRTSFWQSCYKDWVKTCGFADQPM